MNEPITMSYDALMQIVSSTARTAIDITLKELGIRYKTIKPWISQSQASKMIGRKRLERAMREGRIGFYKNPPDKKLGRVYISRKDVEKYINNPI